MNVSTTEHTVGIHLPNVNSFCVMKLQPQSLNIVSTQFVAEQEFAMYMFL